MVKTNVTGLAILGAIVFFGTITHDLLNIHFGTRTTLGPIDVLLCVTGIVFMIPLLSIVSRNDRLSTILGWAGFITVIFSLMHDAIGWYVGSRTGIGPTDALFWLAGIMLMMPYLLSLSRG